VIAEGAAGGVRARIVALALVNNGGAIMGRLASRANEFDSLGGTGLVDAVLASIKVSALPGGRTNRPGRAHERAAQLGSYVRCHPTNMLDYGERFPQQGSH
jgi:hypothetical protein